MTRETAKELLPIIEAYSNGEDVQYFCEINGMWMDTIDPQFYYDYQYRIKPEPKSKNTKQWLENGIFDIREILDKLEALVK